MFAGVGPKKQNTFPHVRWTVHVHLCFIWSQSSCVSIINQCNRTNGTFLPGRFYDCIFSCFYSHTWFTPRRLLKRRTQLRQLWTVNVPLLTRAASSPPASCFLCVFPSVFFNVRMFESGRPDGGIAADSALIVNTMKRRPCILLNGSKDTKWDDFVWLLLWTLVWPWIEYLCAPVDVREPLYICFCWFF